MPNALAYDPRRNRRRGLFRVSDSLPRNEEPKKVHVRVIADYQLFGEVDNAEKWIMERAEMFEAITGLEVLATSKGVFGVTYLVMLIGMHVYADTYDGVVSQVDGHLTNLVGESDISLRFIAES